MENKTTTELLDMLNKLSEEKGDWQTGGKYEQIMSELKTRYPFYDLFNENSDEGIPALWAIIKELQEDIKSLKRHKHDERTGDVMIRI